MRQHIVDRAEERKQRRAEAAHEWDRQVWKHWCVMAWPAALLLAWVGEKALQAIGL
jgi:hypothetical protein